MNVLQVPFFGFLSFFPKFLSCLISEFWAIVGQYECMVSFPFPCCSPLSGTIFLHPCVLVNAGVHTVVDVCLYTPVTSSV